MNVQAWETREEHLAEDQGKLAVVLPADGGDPDHASMDADAALNWQYQTPAEQWQAMWTAKDR